MTKNQAYANGSLRGVLRLPTAIWGKNKSANSDGVISYRKNRNRLDFRLPRSESLG